MSFIWKRPEGRLKSPQQVAREVYEVAREMGLDDFAAVLAVMCIAQESDFWCPWNRKDPSSQKYPHDSESDDGRSVAYLQQQNGRAGEVLPEGDRDNWWGPMSSRMDLKSSVREFLERLQKNYRQAASDPRMASEFISNVQRPRADLRGAYAKHWDRAWELVRAVSTNQPVEVPPVADPMRPDFNEINQIAMDNGNHFSVRSRPPQNFFLHTQEGNGNATDLAAYLRSTSGSGAVSYHYTIHQDAKDKGVTVVDVGDTDLYSWSVLNANVFSINLCFAGSRAAQTRDQWIKNYGKAIHVAAYLAVQDCRKYKFSTEVIPPPYGKPRAGISDHKYVTKALGIGDHTDVGDNFPWDLFTESVNHFTDGAPVVSQPVPTTPPPAGVWPKSASDRELLEYAAAQLGPGHPSWKSKGMTLRDKVWELGEE